MADEPAYRLVHDVERFNDYEPGYSYDLKIENIPRDRDLLIFDETPFSVTEPVLYSGHFSILKTLDFPVADNRWIVISKKMLGVLKAVGAFPHLELMTAVANDLITKDQWYGNDGNLRPGAITEDFVTLQLTEHLDIFDYDKSNFTLDHDPQEGSYIFDVEKYVFKIPNEGLPPLFHVKGIPITLFISIQARLALEKAGIAGVEYYSLKGTGAVGDTHEFLPR
jgi:hypothetical protein